MAVPKFFEFFEGFLHAVEDGELHTAKEVREIIAKSMRISDEDRMEMLPSGKQSTFDNRVAWARTYLDKAGLITTPQRGKYLITQAGKEALSSGEKIDLKFLEKSKEFKEFHDATPNYEKENPEDKNESPMEVLDVAYQQINAALASQIMNEVMNLSPTGFERLVVKMLLSMGYGNGIEEAGKVTAVRSDAALTDAAEGIRSQIGLTAVITGCAWCVLLLALAIAQSLMMGERRKELYVWHAIGASRGIVLRVMLRETLLIYLSGSLLGILIASIWSGMAGAQAICIVCLSALIGCISTIGAVKTASRSMNSQMLLTV